MSEQKATNQGTKIWPDASPPEGFMQGPYPSGRKYADPPTPGKLRRGALGRAAPGAVEHALKEGSGRITKINEGTRAAIRKRIQEAIEQGMSPAEAGAYVRAWSGFDEYRAERIARTEMMFSYNAAATRTYAQLGITHVVADDGDEDEECAARHGQVFTVEEAESIEDHPNGTLDWLPIEPEAGAQGVLDELAQARPFAPGSPAAMAMEAQAQAAVQDQALKVAGQMLLDKVKQGLTLSADESQTFSQVVQAGHITSTDAIAAINQGQKIQQQKQQAAQLLHKLGKDELTPLDEGDLTHLIDLGLVSDDAYQLAAQAGQKVKQAKSYAQQWLDDIAHGQEPGWNVMQQLDQYVQQGIITQEQLNAAHLAKQAAKQKMAIDDALNAFENGWASDSQKQLLMDALGQGAMDATQSAKMTQAIAKLMPKATPAEVKQALWDVTTPSFTTTQHQIVLEGIKTGTLSQSEMLGVAKGLVKQMQGGKPLNVAQEQLANELLDKGVMDPDIYLKALKGLQGKVAQAPAAAPTPPAMQPPAPAPTVKPPVSQLKGAGGKSTGKDKFDPAKFAPKDYPDRASHARALGTWQRKTNSQLSWEAKEAMRSYTNSGYREMNDMLRGVDLARHSPDSLRRVKEQVDLVRQSMHPTTQDVVVKRGTTTHMFGPNGNTAISGDEVMRLVQPGTEWIDGGFMSTSINRGHSWSGDVLLELKIPKGTPAAWAQAISSHKHEYEILLDAGTRIVVESVERSPYGGQIKIVAHVKPR